jgi:hypothetical protein
MTILQQTIILHSSNVNKLKYWKKVYKTNTK